MFPASNQFVSRWIPTQERGIANGVIFAGVGVGAGVTPGLISYIMVHYGWRWSFWASALLGLIAGTVWYFFERDTPEQHSSVSAAALEHIQAGRTVKTYATSNRWTANSVEHHFASKEVWAATLGYFPFGYVARSFAWFFILPSQYPQLDLKASATPRCSSHNPCSPPGGAISDKLTVVRQTHRQVRHRGFALATAIFLAFLRKCTARPRQHCGVPAARGPYLSQSSFGPSRRISLPVLPVPFPVS